MRNIYQEHRLKPGDEVIQLVWIDPSTGRERTQLYRYNTAADWREYYLKQASIAVKRERVNWDGVNEVILDNGD